MNMLFKLGTAAGGATAFSDGLAQKEKSQSLKLSEKYRDREEIL